MHKSLINKSVTHFPCVKVKTLNLRHWTTTTTIYRKTWAPKDSWDLFPPGWIAGVRCTSSWGMQTNLPEGLPKPEGPKGLSLSRRGTQDRTAIGKHRIFSEELKI